MTFKDSTHDILTRYYEKNGIDETIKIAMEMLKSKTHKDSKGFLASVHGEICETVCELKIHDFMNNHKEQTKDWIVSKGLILNDPEAKSAYLTELDLTVFTPYKILVIECKSYGGDKTFVNHCTVKRKSVKSVDVYDQHEKHYRTLMKNFSEFRLIREDNLKVAPMRIAYFDFSLGSVTDLRDDKWKKLMPILNVNNIDKMLTTLTNTQINWNMKYIKRGVDILERKKDVRTKKHYRYVTSIHPSH